jgi:hypothetical protein
MALGVILDGVSPRDQIANHLGMPLCLLADAEEGRGGRMAVEDVGDLRADDGIGAAPRKDRLFKKNLDCLLTTGLISI